MLPLWTVVFTLKHTLRDIREGHTHSHDLFPVESLSEEVSGHCFPHVGKKAVVILDNLACTSTSFKFCMHETVDAFCNE